jgi:biopolymer transport protein ExbD
MPAQLRTSRALSALNITPLIDVVFLLLIFFLVASQLADSERELPVELPSAASATPMIERSRELVIDVDRQGEMFFEGVAIDVPQLDQILGRATSGDGERQTVVVRADRDAVVQSVVVVLDACNRAGADYLLATRDEEEGTP